MRRALFVAVFALLIADASGVTSLLVPETCGISATESAPDGGCPAFCVRCACACCASPIVHVVPAIVTGAIAPPAMVPLTPRAALPSGVTFDILHIPKPLLA